MRAECVQNLRHPGREVVLVETEHPARALDPPQQDRRPPGVLGHDQRAIDEQSSGPYAQVVKVADRGRDDVERAYLVVLSSGRRRILGVRIYTTRLGP